MSAITTAVFDCITFHQREATHGGHETSDSVQFVSIVAHESGVFHTLSLKSLVKRWLLANSGWEGKAWIESRRARADPVFAQARDLDQNISTDPAIVLAPHPDDEAIGVGGAIAAHLHVGASVTVVYLTDGSGGQTNPLQVQTRRNEALAIGQTYGIRQVFWDVADTQLTSTQELVGELAQLISSIEPTRIYLPSFFEKHVDHFAANRLAIDAINESGQADIELFGYEVWDNLVMPNYFVDISDYFDTKVSMLRAYVTPMKDTNYVRLCEARAALHHFLQCFGLKEGYAEAFYRADLRTYENHYRAYLDVLKSTGNGLTKVTTN